MDDDGKPTCVFLGAGASACAGYRTFLSFPRMFFATPRRASALRAPDNEYQLLLGIRDQLRRTKRRETLDNYLWILDEYNAWTRTGVSRADLKERFGDKLSFMACALDLRDTVRLVRRRIARLSIEHYSGQPAAGIGFAWAQNVIKLFKTLASKSPGASIFTTNYDLLPEYLFSQNAPFKAWRQAADLSLNDDIAFENGFSAFETTEMLPTTLHTSDETGSPEWDGKYNSPQPNLVQVHRLHGCVGWYYGEQLENAPVRFVYPADPDVFYSDAINYEARLCVMYPGKGQRIGCKPYGPGFKRFHSACQDAGRILFIGFAFEDDDVILAVFSALEPLEKKPTIVVVDPRLTCKDIVDNVRRAADRSSLPLWAPRESDIELVQTEFPPGKEEGLWASIL